MALGFRDFFIINEYGFIAVALSMFCFAIMLGLPNKGEKINWRIVLFNTLGMTITVYIFNVVIVLFKAILL